MITVKTTIPKRLFPTVADFEKVSSGAVNKAVDASHKDFLAIVEEFDTEVRFDVQKAQITKNITSGSVSTTNDVLIWLNFGTEDHIVGKKGQFMSFFPEYYWKTFPGVIGSGQGGPAGVPLAAHGPWEVSGIEAREFDKAIATKNTPFFLNAINAGIDQLIKSLGGTT